MLGVFNMTSFVYYWEKLNPETENKSCLHSLLQPSSYILGHFFLNLFSLAFYFYFLEMVHFRLTIFLMLLSSELLFKRILLQYGCHIMSASGALVIGEFCTLLSAHHSECSHHIMLVQYYYLWSLYCTFHLHDLLVL